MTRPIPNDRLAEKAKAKANAAKPDSRERTLWDTVSRALDSTTTTESARAMLLGLGIPTLRSDAAKLLNRLIAAAAEPAEENE